MVTLNIRCLHRKSTHMMEYRHKKNHQVWLTKKASFLEIIKAHSILIFWDSKDRDIVTLSPVVQRKARQMRKFKQTKLCRLLLSDLSSAKWLWLLWWFNQLEWVVKKKKSPCSTPLWSTWLKMKWMGTLRSEKSSAKIARQKSYSNHQKCRKLVQGSDH